MISLVKDVFFCFCCMKYRLNCTFFPFKINASGRIMVLQQILNLSNFYHAYLTSYIEKCFADGSCHYTFMEKYKYQKMQWKILDEI